MYKYYRIKENDDFYFDFEVFYEKYYFTFDNLDDNNARGLKQLLESMHFINDNDI